MRRLSKQRFLARASCPTFSSYSAFPSKLPDPSRRAPVTRKVSRQYTSRDSKSALTAARRCMDSPQLSILWFARSTFDASMT